MISGTTPNLRPMIVMSMGAPTFLLCEGHVFLSVGNTHGTLLTVSRGELVTNGWHPQRPHTDLRELVTTSIHRQHNLTGIITCTARDTLVADDLIHNTIISALEGH